MKRKRATPSLFGRRLAFELFRRKQWAYVLVGLEYDHPRGHRTIWVWRHHGDSWKVTRHSCQFERDS